MPFITIEEHKERLRKQGILKDVLRELALASVAAYNEKIQGVK